jgi:hypothetical protein
LQLLNGLMELLWIQFFVWSPPNRRPPHYLSIVYGT